MARKSKSYFFDAPDNSTGVKFSRYNHPTKEVFIELFNSLLFPNDSEDTARENFAGHVKMASDNESMSRAVSTDKHSKAVRSYQLPTLMASTVEVIGEAAEYMGLRITPVTINLGGSKKRLSYMVEAITSGSVNIDQDTKRIRLHSDIDSPLLSGDNEKYYGVRGQARGFFKPLPDRAKGTLKCRLVAGYEGTYELYWDDTQTAQIVTSRRLYASYTVASYAGPTGNEILKSFTLPSEYMSAGMKFKIRGVFELQANLGLSKVECRLSLADGSAASIPFALRTDGNMDGFIEIEGEVIFFNDQVISTNNAEYAKYHAKSFNSGTPSEVIVHNFNTNWNFGGSTSPMKIELRAERSVGGGSIGCHLLEVEFIKI